MNEDGNAHYFCKEHKPQPIPVGYRGLPNLLPKRCECCGEVAEVEVAPKPLSYPKFTTA